MTAALDVVMVPIDAVAPHPRNPRRGDVEAIARSLAEPEGQYQPLVVQRSSGHILVGNHRWLAARSLGWVSIAVVYLDVSDDRALALMLRDNRTHDLGDYDERMLAELLGALDADVLPASIYDRSDLDVLLRHLDAPGSAAATSNHPAPPIREGVRLGDRWRLGEHLVICGDSTTDLSRHVSGAHLVFTSPPYGVGIDYGDGYVDDIPSVVATVKAAAQTLADIVRPGGFAVVNFGDVVSGMGYLGTDEPAEVPMGHVYWDAFTAAGWLLNTRRIWAKPHARVAAPWCASSNRAASDWEHLWTFKRPGRGLNERREPWSYLGVWDTSHGERGDIPDKDDFGAGMPLELAMRAILVYSDPGDVVVDPFAGTGTTLIAADRLGRIGVMMDRDPRAVGLTIARWEQHTGESARKEDPA